MKALSLWQPWASAIALGHKRIETRSWSTPHRGPIAIHASKRWTAEEREDAAHFARVIGDERLLAPPLGAVVATARLVSVFPTEALDDMIDETERMLGNYAPNRYGFRLEDVRPLPRPLPFTGRQGMFVVPDEEIRAAMAG